MAAHLGPSAEPEATGLGGLNLMPRRPKPLTHLKTSAIDTDHVGILMDFARESETIASSILKARRGATRLSTAMGKTIRELQNLERTQPELIVPDSLANGLVGIVAAADELGDALEEAIRESCEFIPSGQNEKGYKFHVYLIVVGAG